jgi:uncharacterized membrane protein YciS (DUF1049 family)
MKNDLDDKLRAALREELGDDGMDPGLIEMTLGVFRSRNRFITVGAVVVSMGIFALAVWTVFRFFEAETTRWQIFWAALFLYLGMAIGFIKVWFWMEMQRAAMTRELKRMELQLARVVAGREGSRDT